MPRKPTPRVPCICKRCGVTFGETPANIRRGRGKYCTNACYLAGGGRLGKRMPDRWITAPCPVCGQEMTYRVCKPKAYCSVSCGLKSHGLNTGRSEIRVPIECETCATIFWVAPSTRAQGRRYCSRACTLTAYETTCLVCGTSFVTTPAVHKKCCSHACANVGRRGENSPRWKGGWEPYYGASWAAARLAVRQRDRVCQRCGRTEEETGRQMDVHHRIPFRLFGRKRHEEADVLSNLIAYCQRCHQLMEASQDSPVG